MSKSKKELAAAAFAKYKDAKKVYVSDDGNVFLNKNAADLYANTNSAKKKLKIDEFVRTDGSTKKPTVAKTAAKKGNNGTAAPEKREADKK